MLWCPYCTTFSMVVNKVLVERVAVKMQNVIPPKRGILSGQRGTKYSEFGNIAPST